MNVNQSCCGFAPFHLSITEAVGCLCTGCLTVLTRISASSPQAAIHLLSKKIQSPQEKEALQALTVCNGDPHLLTF